jgi:hypothetical protein
MSASSLPPILIGGYEEVDKMNLRGWDFLKSGSISRRLGEGFRKWIQLHTEFCTSVNDSIKN